MRQVRSHVFALVPATLVVLTACAGEPARAPAPAAAEDPIAGPPLADDVACRTRRAHDATCGKTDPRDLDLFAEVCASERTCLELTWTSEATNRYMKCRAVGACGLDCRREAAKHLPSTPAAEDAAAQCARVCPGDDGKPLCATVLGRFSPWKLSAQAEVSACFAGASDCFAGLGCAESASRGPTAELDACITKAVVTACATQERLKDSPTCARVARSMGRP